MTVRYDLTEPGAGVATLTLDRPDARNALDRATKDALLEALDKARDDARVRAVVLTGAGRTFCAGQDLREHAADLRAGRLDDVWRTVPEHYIPIARGLATMPKPVVAAVNGIAAGAGAALTFACDFRVLASDAGFALAFSAIGLPCDTGTSWHLPRLIGWARAVDLLMRPRTVSAREALEIGLATSVVPPEDLERAARELATELAAGPTVAYAGIKTALAFSASHGLDQTLAVEGEMMRRAGATDDHQRAVEAFLAKERPTFSGR
ncbi:MAG TPA: enoyl-CoA hydratase-related protein [Actinopolymorphaceae bacterium]